MNDGHDPLRSLYRAARLQEQPSRCDRKAVRASLALAATASVHGAAVAASAATAKGLIQMLVAGKFVSGLLVGAVLGTAVVSTSAAVFPASSAAGSARQLTVARRALAPPTRSAQAAPSGSLTIEAWVPEQQGQDTPSRIVTALPEPSAMAATLPTEPVRHAAAAAKASSTRLRSSTRFSSDATVVSTPSHRTTADALMRESEGLASAQAALDSHEPLRALAILDTQQRSFPSGQLAEERAAAMILALCAAGRRQEAELVRRGFVVSYPKSPFGRRIRESCENR